MKNNILKITIIIIFVFTVLFMFFTNSAYSGTVESINVHKDSIVSGTKVLLGEISTIDGSLDWIQGVENIIKATTELRSLSNSVQAEDRSHNINKANLICFLLNLQKLD